MCKKRRGIVKKFTSELSEEQGIVYHHLQKNVNDDGSNLVSLWVEISEFYEEVPSYICETYEKLSSIEQIEVIHFITKKIIRKNK